MVCFAFRTAIKSFLFLFFVMGLEYWLVKYRYSSQHYVQFFFGRNCIMRSLKFMKSLKYVKVKKLKILSKILVYLLQTK